MCVVVPGKQPVTESERVLSTSSGHIIHLMPGDNHYDPSSFCVVIAWNGLNHYIPTYIMRHNSILQHRCSVISKLLSTATDLFGDIESDLDESQDQELIEQFHSLRDQTVQANHLLAVRGLEHPKLPTSTAGPHPNDVSSHLTRKTPLPVHPEPLIAHALQHPLDPDSALRRQHPTPYMQPPPQELKREDFQIDPADFTTDKPRCVKVAGQVAPGKLSYPRERLLISIPFPLDPTKGYPPADPKSIGAKRFKEECPVKAAGQAELTKIVQDLPVSKIVSSSSQEVAKSSRITQESVKGSSQEVVKSSRITHKSVKGSSQEVVKLSRITHKSGKGSSQEVVKSSRITHKSVSTSSQEVVESSRITQESVSTSSQGDVPPPVDIPTVIDVDEQLDQIAQTTSQHRCVCPPDQTWITQEEEEIVIPDEDEDDVLPFTISSETVEEITIEDDPEQLEQEKLKSLKRKHIPSRKSPRVKIPRLDLKKGVSSGLPQQQKKVVENLAKKIVSQLKPKQSKLPHSSKQDPVSSSSSSSHSSGKQRSVLEMYAQAARRIAQPSKASGSQRTGSAQPDQSAQPQPQLQVVQSHPPVLNQPCRITHDPPLRRRIAQSQSSQDSSQDYSEKRLFKCIYCSYSTVRKESLTDHIRQHTGEKFKCQDCPKDYFSEKGLKLHIKTKHMNIDTCLCTQLGCTWSGKDYGLRIVHLYEEHGIGPAPVCDHPDCRDRGHFSNYRTLERYRETFHKTAELQCPYCEKMYKEQGNLAHHIEVAHKGKPYFQCDICGGFYSSKKSLQGHQRKDHNS